MRLSIASFHPFIVGWSFVQLQYQNSPCSPTYLASCVQLLPSASQSPSHSLHLRTARSTTFATGSVTVCREHTAAQTSGKGVTELNLSPVSLDRVSVLVLCELAFFFHISISMNYFYSVEWLRRGCKLSFNRQGQACLSLPQHARLFWWSTQPVSTSCCFFGLKLPDHEA